MLIELSCDTFGSIKRIVFRDGLNIVQGMSGNSIGKSTILKVIDFAFGGNYYKDSNEDIIREIGHHTIKFAHKFGSDIYYFSRSTNRPNIIYKCNAQYEEIEPLKSIEFGSFLIEHYQLTDHNAKWRSLVSLFSRIWNKENKDVKRPLYLHSSQKTEDAILLLIQLFNLHHSIISLKEKQKLLEEKGNAWKNARKFELLSIPKNDEEVAKLRKKYEAIENSVQILRKSILLSSVDNFENLEIKLNDLFNTKKALLAIRGRILREISRIEKDCSLSVIDDEFFTDGFTQLFPEVNIEKLHEISSFHNKIAQILHDELDHELVDLRIRYKENQTNLSEVDVQLSNIANIPKTARESLATLVEQSKQLDRLNQSLSLYFKQKENKDSIAAAQTSLDESMVIITNQISESINKQIRTFCSRIDSANSEAPEITLAPHQYKFGVANNTGTGKAYTDLILFDLSVFSLTDLPIIIHDSYLFNNINQRTIEDFLKFYNEFEGKQVFISLDDIIKSNDEHIQEIIFQKTVLSLSESMMLFGKDWRSKTESE